MKKILLLSILLIDLFGLAPNAFSEVNVFACEPEWEALAKELGGDYVETFAATSARQDPHYIRAKPSLIAATRRADLIVCSGASLEIGWLPLLLQKSGNANTLPGGRGFLLASDYVETLEKPQSIDRSEGDVHPEGNPHLHLNPHNISIVAIELNKRLKEIDPDNAEGYQRNFDNFTAKWKEAMSRWEEEGKNLKDARVVVHHTSFSYLVDWLGLKQVGTLEPKPGIPPTTSHLESLLLLFKDAPPQFILRTPYDPEDASE